MSIKKKTIRKYIFVLRDCQMPRRDTTSRWKQSVSVTKKNQNEFQSDARSSSWRVRSYCPRGIVRAIHHQKSKHSQSRVLCNRFIRHRPFRQFNAIKARGFNEYAVIIRKKCGLCGVVSRDRSDAAFREEAGSCRVCSLLSSKGHDKEDRFLPTLPLPCDDKSP